MSARPSPPRLRPATLDDLDAIAVIENELFPGDSWSRELLRSELVGPYRHYLVAEAEHGGIDGYAGLLAPDGSDEADIQTLAVVTSARRHGLGELLVRTLLAEARRRGAREVLLEVRTDNADAQRLYRRLGFEVIAVREHYYQPDDVAALVMRVALSEPAESVEDPA